MGRSAMSKLQEAKELDKQADSLKARDPSVSQSFRDLAHAKRRSAIKQMRTKPKPKGSGSAKGVLK